MPQALVEEHRVLLDSVQNNKPLNMLREMVNSTLMAILKPRAATGSTSSTTG
ncbi:MAG: hypothetical protein ACLUKN_10880 [Bacilli bacterium]